MSLNVTFRILMVGLCCAWVDRVTAQFEEPDNLIFGTITGNGVPVTRLDTHITVDVRKAIDGVVLAAYTMGDEEGLGDFYRVKVPLKRDDGIRPPDDLVVGDTVLVIVRDEHNDLSSVAYTIEERGRPVRLDLGYTGVCTQAVAGPDQEVCGTSTTLAGNAPEVGTGIWSIVAGEGGFLGDASNPTSSFSGLTGETYILEWLIHHEVFIDTMDEVTIIFVEETVAEAGPDGEWCAASGTLAGNVPIHGAGMWTIDSGSGGILGDATKPAATFTGQPGMTYVLTWTLDNGPCDDSSDSVTIAVLSAPIAGPTQFVCDVSTVLAAVPPTVGTGHWEIRSGLGGTLIDPGNPTTLFQGVEGLTYLLSWVVAGTACQLEDQTQVTFSGLTCSIFVEHEVFCGIDEPHELFAQVRCGATPYTYSWTLLSGPPEGGTFSNPAIPNPTFTPHGVGMYEIQVTVEDDTGRSVDATLSVFAPDIDIDGQAGITQADFTFRLPYWHLDAFPLTVDVDDNGTIDVRDFLIVLPCFDPP